MNVKAHIRAGEDSQNNQTDGGALCDASCSASSFGGDAAFNYVWNKVNTNGEDSFADGVIKEAMQEIWDTMGAEAYSTPYPIPECLS